MTEPFYVAAPAVKRAITALDNMIALLDAYAPEMEGEDVAVIAGAREDMEYAKAAYKRGEALTELAEDGYEM